MINTETLNLRSNIRSHLGDPFEAMFDTPGFMKYRVDYQMYRRGYHKGAKGELAEVFDECNSPKDEKFASIFRENNRQGYNLLSEWRHNYRAFRRGEAHGSEGELGKLVSLFTKDYLRLLPVSQLKELREYELLDELFRKRPLSQFHVQVGAGKLGLGLIVPALRESNFAILQRDSEDWKHLKSNQKIKLYVNDKSIVTLLVIRKEEDIPDLDQLDQLEGDSKIQLLIITDHDSDLCKKILEKAQTISTALGPALDDVKTWIASKIIANNNNNNNKINDFTASSRSIKSTILQNKQVLPIYCFENDHAAVGKLETLFDNTNVKVIPCMVDRICATRKIDNETIHITAESYLGEIVLLCPPFGMTIPHLTGENINIPEFEAAAKYFLSRKILCVNGMHTTLAFLTLCNKCNLPTQRRGSTTQQDVTKKPDYTLLTWDSASEEDRKLLLCWMVARVFIIFFEHDIEIIKQAHQIPKDDKNANLLAVQAVLNYAHTCLIRISTVEDTTARVLGGGVANRFNGRLLNVPKFLQNGLNDKRITKLILKESKLTYEEIQFYVNKLVTNSQKFADADTSQKK